MAVRTAPVQAPPRWRELTRGALALIAIAVLVVGVPLGLAVFVGWPLPTSIPAWSEITAALGDSYVPDAFLAKALALVCWIVWVELVASLLVEALAVLRGRSAARIPLAGPVQRLVARLVTAVSILVILLLTRPGHSDLQPVPPPPAATAGPGSPIAVDAGHMALSPEDQDMPVYEVQRRDTLWGIAEAHLGDPFRWVEIWEVNRDRPQPDGGALVDPDRIHPGWCLVLPADAVGLAPPGAAEASSPPATDPAPSEAELMTVLEPDATAADGDVLRVSGASGASGGEGGEIIIPLAPAAGSTDQSPLLAAEDGRAGPEEAAPPMSPPSGRRAPS